MYIEYIFYGVHRFVTSERHSHERAAFGAWLEGGSYVLWTSRERPVQ